MLFNNINCTCCAYTTIIYSDTEWLEVSYNPSCKRCDGNCERKSGEAFIFRDDMEEDIPLLMHGCLMPDGKQFCENAVEEGGSIHWTTVLVSCPICDDDTMLFTKYRQGENILEFYEHSVNVKKLAHPPLLWLDENGNFCLHFNWPGNDFSST